MREFNTHTHTHTTRDTVVAILGGELLAATGEGHVRGGSGVRRGARLTLDVYYTFDGSGAACGGRLVEERQTTTLTSGGAAVTLTTEQGVVQRLV
ncbi:hypothetical protein OROHE_006237 [Orobanche hederae]